MKDKDKNKMKATCSIVDEIKIAHGTSLNERTVRLYANHGVTDVPMTGRGKKILHGPVELALSSAILFYIQLSNAGISKILDRKRLTQQMKLCLNGGAYAYKRYDHLYDRIMRTIADKVDVNGDDYKMEQRRLIWTTYKNMNIWFETLIFLIDKGFAREKNDENRLVLGELVYFES